MSKYDPPSYAETGEALRDFYERTHRVLDRQLTARKSSMAQFKFMSFIQRQGVVRSVDLVQAFGYAPRTITEAVDSLERNGLVTREQDPADRRAKNISLTPEGKGVLDAAEPVMRQFGDEVFSVLSDKEQQQLGSLLRRLNARIAQFDNA